MLKSKHLADLNLNTTQTEKNSLCQDINPDL
jgi:hypothetical protein